MQEKDVTTTLAERLAELRREHGYTQEELAEILSVTRQSVSRWESGAAIPETEKLLRISKLYGCSLDSLISEEQCQDQEEKADCKGEETDREAACNEDENSQKPEIKGTFPLTFKLTSFEQTSKIKIGKLPLWQTGRKATAVLAVGVNARGVVAIGLYAQGLVTLGGLSVGVLSFGWLAIGLLAAGVYSLGLAAFGAIAVGLFAAGAISIGVISFGAVAIGEFSSGALAIGKYFAKGDDARAMVAIGKTAAKGSLFEHVGTEPVSSAELSLIKAHLDQTTPKILEPAKNLFIKHL